MPNMRMVDAVLNVVGMEAKQIYDGLLAQALNLLKPGLD
ncbi:hypothetical protein M7I_3180 [Glarea lozoyensis 74030]|uniref:Uncharacterized protein n=1 Tax=Glarea lozoyensis (strain ATCC 74030 / MF5533) TaxID=1104152 RepID=H0EKU7_GLAL7|nr:hypothetical protein M7I_3180 [Glarea lozoyensis 74030]